MENILLNINELTTCFFTENGPMAAVDGLSFALREEETLAIVGESGCGKSTVGLSIINLLPANGKIMSGSIIYKNENLLEKTPAQMRKLRGQEISMIFQEPVASLNPVFKIGNQLIDTILFHENMTVEKARLRATELLNLVGIPDPFLMLDSYPHQLSGGMCQRVMTAMALALSPGILIADEPTTSLDVTIQAQILRLIKDIKVKTGMSMILITHDMGVVAQTADNVMVMYAGQAVEYCPVREIFKNPAHPYTVGLLKSMPGINDSAELLYSIQGSAPPVGEYPSGCRFSPRCDCVWDICHRENPPLKEVAPGHFARCHRAFYNGDGRGR